MIRIIALWTAFQSAQAQAPAQPEPPSRESLAALERPLAAIRTVVDTRLVPAQRLLLQIEKRVGLRDDNGASLRPHLPNPDYFELKAREIDAFAERHEKFHRIIMKAFAQLSRTERADYARATAAYSKAIIEIKPLTEEAINQAIATYGIPRRAGPIVNGPPKPAGTDDVPSFRGRSVEFSPFFNPSIGPDRFGVTTDEGRVEIGLSAFAYPGRLGTTLFHEGLHFADLLDASVDLRNAPAAEVRIRRRMTPLLKPFFDLRTPDIEQHESKILREEALAEKWRLPIARGFSPWKKSHRPVFPLDMLPLRPYDSGELDRILEQAATDSEYERDPYDPLPNEAATIYEGGGKHLRDLDDYGARQAAEQCAADALEAEVLASQDPDWNALRGWASAACRYLEPAERLLTGADSGSPDFDYMQWALAENAARAKAKEAADRGTRMYLLTHFVVVLEPRIRSLLRDRGDELGSCERSVLRMILKAPGPISAEWLVSQLDSRKAGGSIGRVVRALTKALKRSSEAIVHGIQAPFIAVSSAATATQTPARKEEDQGRTAEDGDSEVREPAAREPYRPGPRKIWQGSPTLERLKGIAGGSITF